jgi:uncharacterized membrane protein
MPAKRRLTTRDVVYIGILSALCAIGTSLKIPLPTGGMVHLGTAVIFTVAILYGGVFAGFSGAIGSALFDLVMGFSPYTPWSFVIKGIAGLLAGTVARGLWPEAGAGKKSWLLRALVGCILAACWTLGGYLLAWWQILGSLTAALAAAPSSLLTSGTGLVVAIVLTLRLRNRVRY